jgi:hypothetical protein
MQEGRRRALRRHHVDELGLVAAAITTKPGRQPR